MSLESKIVLLIAAVEANTAAVLGNASTTVTTSAAVAPAPAPTTAAPVTAASIAVAAPVPIAAPSPAPIAAAPVTPPVAVAPAAVSPSEVAITLEQLQQEVTAIYQAKNGDPRIMATVQQYGASLGEIPAEQYAAVIAAVRAL